MRLRQCYFYNGHTKYIHKISTQDRTHANKPRNEHTNADTKAHTKAHTSTDQPTNQPAMWAPHHTRAPTPHAVGTAPHDTARTGAQMYSRSRYMHMHAPSVCSLPVSPDAHPARVLKVGPGSHRTLLDHKRLHPQPVVNLNLKGKTTNIKGNPVNVRPPSGSPQAPRSPSLRWEDGHNQLAGP